MRKVPGVVSARRLRVVMQDASELQVPRWSTMVLYELETDDPQKVRQIIKSLAGTEAMPLSEAHDRRGMVQVIAEPVG
jgi:hypothetical protein